MTMGINEFIAPFVLSLRLSLVTTPIMLGLCLPLSALLAFKNFKGKALFETVFILPMVLPPTVLGFYFLYVFSPANFFGSFIKDTLGFNMLFTFQGLVLAAIIYSFPFMIQTLVAGMKKVPKNIIEASYSLGKGRLETFFRIIIPLIKNSIIAAVILTFSKIFGEFGVAIMVGGNIPGKTRLASIALYESVESLEYGKAHQYAFILLCFSGIVLYAVNRLNNSGEIK